MKFLLCLFALAAIVAFSHADTDASSNMSEVLWDRYQQVLMSFIRKSNNPDTYKGLQVVTEPLDATWHSGKSEVLNLLMDRSSRYGSIYSPSSLTYSSQYDSFLFNLKFPEVGSPSAADQQKMWKLREKMMETEMRRIQAQNLCYEDYEFFKGISPEFASMSYTIFEASQCQSTLGPIHRELMNLNSDLTTLTTRMDGAHKKIIDAITRYTTDTNAGAFRETKTSLDTFLDRARSRAGTPVSFALNSKTTLSEKREWIKKKKSGFLMFKSSSKTVKTEYRFQSEDFEMKISCDSFGKIDIAPKGDWFSRSAVTAYRNNKNMWIDKSKNYFGKSGTLTLLPKAVYVMYNPKVTLKCSEKDAYSLNELKQKSFSFGPIASNKGSTLNIEKINDKNYKVTFDSNSDTPQIIAVDHHVF